MRRQILALLTLLAFFAAPLQAAIVIKSGATTDQMTVGVTSKAARVTCYDGRGNDVGMKVGYSAASVTKLAAPTGTGVFAMIFGSATKTIRIQRIILAGCIATTAINADIAVWKRTAVGSGGTCTTLNPVAKDSGSAAGTATNVKFCTAAPTAGTGGNVAFAQSQYVGVCPAIGQAVVFDWTAQGMNEAPVLRGTGEGLELTYGTTAANAVTETVQIEWTEE